MGRAYQSPLRQEQAELTRRKILEAIAAILAEDGAADLTVAAAAKRAGVSVRTAYTYFPTRESLFDGFNEWLAEQVKWSKFPDRSSDIPDQARQFFSNMDDKQVAFFRAARMSPVGEQIRKRRKAKQVQSFARALDDATAHLDRDDARRIAAIVHSLGSSDTFLGLHDYWGLSSADAGEAAAWAIETLIAAAKKRKRAP